MRRPGDLVDLAGHWTLDRIARNSWSTPRGSGDGRESSRTACRTRSPLDPSASRPGELVHTRAIGTQPELPGTAVQHREHGRGHDSPRTAGRHRRHSDPSTRRPGELVDPAGPPHPSESSLEELVHTAGPRTRAQVPQDSWSSPRDLRHGPELSGTAGRRRGLRTRVRDAQMCWSTPRAFGPWPGTSGTVGRHHGPMDTGPNRPGKLIDRVGHQTRGRVTWESWSTPHALGPEHESPRRAG